MACSALRFAYHVSRQKHFFRHPTRIFYCLFTPQLCGILKKKIHKEVAMKILITGSSGFFGRRAAVYLSSLGFQVLTPSHSELDITQIEAVHHWFEQHRPQAVLHCAAVSDTGKCQNDPEGTARINVDGSVNLAKACHECGARLIFCSSDQVYATSSLPGPHKESEILDPGTVYAKQKLLAEQQCSAACTDTVSLRLSWMYATTSLPNEHGHLLASLRATLRDPRLPLSWPVYDHRGITNVEEVIHQLPAALKLPAGVYNFGSGNDANTYSTIQAVLEDLNLTDALRRLTPNLQAFSDSPRDIRMDPALAASHGIHFRSTRDSLRDALSQIL